MRGSLLDHLLPVPVFYSLPETPESNRKLYAVCNTNFDTLALYSSDRKIGAYELPVYKDRQGTVEKIALTPVAVTADAAIVGGCAGVIVWYYLAESNYGFQVGK